MDILFWSGGKDAYLALEFLQRDYNPSSIKLITTFNESSNRVPHQEIPISNIQEQADELDLDLITVGLPENCPNDIYLDKLQTILDREEREKSIRYLVFGDWYLEDIRDWREENFRGMGYECLFPIWKKELDRLLPVLLLKPVTVKISAVAEEYQQYLKVGEEYNLRLIRQLPEEIDPMGENGEFHTEVIFQDLRQAE